MDTIVFPYVLDDAWRVFLTEARAAKRAIAPAYTAPVRKTLTDAYVAWAAGVPELASNPERFARRFAVSLAAYAGTTDLPALASSQPGREEIARGFRRFLDAQPTPPSAGIISPLAEVAVALEKNGDAEEADLAWRQLFALGLSDPRIDAAIDRITEETLRREITFEVGSGVTSVPVSSVGAIRAVLEDSLGSRITLADIVDLLDIGEPTLSLHGVRMEWLTPDQVQPTLRFYATYVDAGGRLTGSTYVLSIATSPDGTPEIPSRFIQVAPSLRRFGIASRSLLAIALFARRHGMQNWKDTAADLGALTWPTLGGVVDPKSLREVMESLAILKDSAGFSGLDLDSIDPGDIATIIGLKAWEADLSSLEDFYEWASNTARLSYAEIAAFGEPYPVGAIALRGAYPRISYDTRRVLDLLVGESIPRKIERLEQRGTLQDSRAASGLRVALYQAEMTETIAREVRRLMLPAPASFGGVEVQDDAPEDQGGIDGTPLSPENLDAAATATDDGPTAVVPAAHAAPAPVTGCAVSSGAR